jgi:pimeloyl-ACP methyl ester carboxylesterase
MSTTDSVSHVISDTGRMALSTRTWGGGVGEQDILLLHGLGDSSTVWQRIAPRLVPHGRVVAADLRGHGDSGHNSNGRYVTGDFVSDVVSVIRGLGSSSIVLVGHSLGAEIALCTAARLSRSVRALVLIDGGVGLNRTAAAYARKLLREQAWSYTSASEYASALMDRIPMGDPSLLQQVAKDLLKIGTDGRYELKFDRKVLAGENDVDDRCLWALLGNVRCPILIVRGIASAVFPKTSADAIARLVDRCRFSTIAAAGHAVMLENGDGLVTELTAFLSTVRKA